MFQALSAAAAAIRNTSVSAEEVAAAKKHLLNDAYGIILENSLSRAEDLGLQALIRKEILPVAQVPDLIGSVQLGDVQVKIPTRRWAVSSAKKPSET